MKKDYEAMKATYGSVEYEGKEYAMTEHAHIENVGVGDAAYFANAIDKDGEKYVVQFDILPEYEMRGELMGLQQERNESQRHGEDISEAMAQRIESLCRELNITNYDASDPYSLFDVQLEEEFACDWYAPADVTKQD